MRCSVRGPTGQRALARLTPIVYDEPHRLAHHYLKRERAGHSLQTTALVNEAYMRLVDYKRMQWQNRAHFMAAARSSTYCADMSMLSACRPEPGFRPKRPATCSRSPSPTSARLAIKRLGAFAENCQVPVIREDAVPTKPSQFTNEADVYERRHSLR